MGGPRGVIRPGVNFAARTDVQKKKPSGQPTAEGDAQGQQVLAQQQAAGVAGEKRTKANKKKSQSVEGGGEDIDAPDAGGEPSGDAERATTHEKGKKARGTGEVGEGAGDAVAARADGSGRNDSGGTNGGKKNKKGRQKQLMAHLSLRAEATTPVASRDHPFEVEAADHCETPFQAYQDIEPFLFRVALALKKPKDKLRIYDPYFCEGSVTKHLARLGFTNVHNANEDFYKCIDDGTIPEHDVLLTNPPYSGDHFRRILSFCGASKKPWLLLLPNFVCRKQYYQPAIGGDGVSPLFLIPDPLKPYRYWAPGRKGFEERNLAKGTTPFETFWYVDMATLAPHDDVRAWWLRKYAPHSTCALPPNDEALPQQQRLQKRGNPRARKIAAHKEREDGRGNGDGGGDGGGSLYYDPEKAKAAKMREQGGGRGQGMGARGAGGGRGGYPPSGTADAGSGERKRSGDTRGRGGGGGGRGDQKRQKR